ncbi:MAG: 5-(carboxyamino)imidazole ribonucleotide synthase [Flavobacteriia bacterium]|nr:5-(carboxyamino)imidazole ribonucleotide synthase [Flavobacteriia bacterium]
MKNKWYSDSFKIGILGGGQLGRMLIQAATDFNMNIYCMDSDINSPSAFSSKGFTQGNILSYDEVLHFAEDKDIISIEIENVNVDALYELEKRGKKVFPQARVIELIQDKALQKKFYIEHNIPTSPFNVFNNRQEIIQYFQKNDFRQVVQKLRKGGYDGKGVCVVNNYEKLQDIFDAPCIIEEKVKIIKEISVIVARNEKGECVSYPAVECAFNQEANLVDYLFSPAEIDEKLEEEAQELSKLIIQKLDMVGLLAVEFFIDTNNNVLVNEMAPRPHNSGHHTIECSVTSQFEQMLRAINNLPLGKTDNIQKGIMINVLGENGFNGKAHYENIEKIVEMQNVHLHLYGKEETKSYRKMGHITVCGEDLNLLKNQVKFIKETLKVRI